MAKELCMPNLWQLVNTVVGKIGILMDSIDKIYKWSILTSYPHLITQLLHVEQNELTLMKLSVQSYVNKLSIIRWVFISKF